jgi:hypothetical protein
MIAKRKELPMLAKGKLEWLLDTPKGTLCFVRSEGRGKSLKRLVALHNLSDETHTIPLADAAELVDAFDASAEVGEYITLPPYGYRWFVSK